MKRLIAMLLLVAMMVSAFALAINAEETTTTADDDASAPSEECVESQKNPDWLITEISEDQTGDGMKLEWYNTPYGGKDIFEMMEIYNNSGEALNLYDYAMAYNGSKRGSENFEHQIKELTPFLTNNEYSSEPGNFFDGTNPAAFGPEGPTGDQKVDGVVVGTYQMVMPTDNNPETCVVQPGECVVLWFRYYESYLNCYHDNTTTEALDGTGATVADFRAFWGIDDSVKVIMVDANGNTSFGGNDHNFNVKNSDCGTYSIVKYNEELVTNCNTPDEAGAQAAGLMTEGYWTYEDMVCWASVDFTSSMPGKGTANYTYNFVPDLGEFSATRFGYVWSGGRMAILEYNATPSVGYLTDLQKLYIEPETLEQGTSIALNGNNTALYIYSFDWRTTTHRYNFYGFTINGQNYKWSSDTFVVPAGGVTEFAPYYEEIEITTAPEEEEDDPVDTPVDTTTANNTTTKAPVTTAKPVDTDAPAEKGCGGFAVAAQLIAVLCSSVAFVVIKKRK